MLIVPFSLTDLPKILKNRFLHTRWSTCWWEGTQGKLSTNEWGRLFPACIVTSTLCWNTTRLFGDLLLVLLDSGYLSISGRVPNAPMYPMYIYMQNPAMKVIIVYYWYLLWLLFLLRIGMNIVWMENAWPMEAAKLTTPLPNPPILAYPLGAVASIQTKNIQYPTQLTIP